MTNYTAEIVTFRSAAGANDTALIDAAGGIATFLGAQPGFVSRTLSKGDDGVWTDYVLWTGMDHAKAAADKIMHDPAAGPFMALVDPDSIVMRHAYVVLDQAA